MAISIDDSISEAILNTNKINSIKASQIKRVPVEWIWDNRLAVSKLTLLGGDPGLCKSQIAIYAIAAITTGLQWCDGGTAPIGNCIILSAEDAANDTICPRLDPAGANSDRVHIIRSVSDKGVDRSFNLQNDSERLETMIEEIGDVRLIMIDPITAYLGDKIDSHQTTDIRAVLEPLARFAEKHKVAILAITHPPKAAQHKAINSFTGSLAFAAAARIVLIAIEEADSPMERKLLLGVKIMEENYQMDLAICKRKQ
jgi:putative DNA primase/helicase